MTFCRKNKQTGFTLIELLVVVALLGIIMSTSLFSYDRFGKDVELENSVYSMALAIREAQVYGVNKKARDGVADPKEFGEDYGYGIHLTNVTTGSNANDKTFVLFEDQGVTPNEIFDAGSGCDISGGECYSQFLLTKGNYIAGIYGRSTGSWSEIGHDGDVTGSWSSLTQAGSVDIFFKRPNPDAKIKAGGTPYERVCILIKDPSATYARAVEVGVAGDITIKRECTN